MTKAGAYRILTAAFLLVAVLAGCSGSNGSNGAPGAPGPPGASAGTLAGTVTNKLTGSPLQGATVSVDPTVQGVSMTTDAGGKYSCSLPIGSYTLTFQAPNYTTATEAVSVVAGGGTTIDMPLVPTAPVVITTAVQGQPLPGATVTATANVQLMDGSSLVGVTWTQSSGVPLAFPPGSSNQTFSGNPLQITLADLTAFKNAFFDVVANQRHALLDRFMVMAVNPLDLEDASAMVLQLTVQTSTGTYTQNVEIDAVLPFVWNGGIRNVPTGLPVLLHGKDAGTYDWKVQVPSGSQLTALDDATTQNPYFTPDIQGSYTLTEAASGATLQVYAGDWVGAIGPNGDSSALCTTCHNDSVAPDKFTSWRQTGHAAIFTKNLNAGGHYGTACFPCHTVGYNTAADNSGFDDTPGYLDFFNLFFPGGSPVANPDNWTNMLAQFPEVARLANIQCENCHGPNNSPAHMDAGGTDDSGRLSLSADVCGQCHGEPPRHGDFQQWQESAHGNYTVALQEATVENRGSTAAHCGRCHSAQGFLTWINQGDLTKLIQGANGNATVAELTTLGLTVDTVQPQTCPACHDPHAEGTVSGKPNTATVRISGDTPMLPAGYAATGVGRGAICITCHNTRNGLHNDDVGAPPDYSAPHTAAQGDVLMGENAYFVTVGQRSRHSYIADTCATCHMELTPPPAQFSYQGSGTNHSFTASPDICGNCHGAFDGGTLQASTETQIEGLAGFMSANLLNRISAAGTLVVKDYTPHQLNGNSYDLKSAAVTVPASNIAAAAPTEPHGQQGYTVDFTTPVSFTYSPPGEAPHTLTLNAATVQLGDFTLADGTTALVPKGDVLVKAGWDYFLVSADGSKGVHNPSFVSNVISAAQQALQNAPAP